MFETKFEMIELKFFSSLLFRWNQHCPLRSTNPAKDILYWFCSSNTNRAGPEVYVWSVCISFLLAAVTCSARRATHVCHDEYMCWVVSAVSKHRYAHSNAIISCWFGMDVCWMTACFCICLFVQLTQLRVSFEGIGFLMKKVRMWLVWSRFDLGNAMNWENCIKSPKFLWKASNKTVNCSRSLACS